MNVDDSEISLVKVQFDSIFVKNLAVVEHLTWILKKMWDINPQ